AVGILIKGPMILMVVGLAAATLVVLDRSARWLLTLRPIAGLLWLLILVLPWFIAIYARVGTQFLIGSVGEDMLAKVASPQETHGAPPGLYVILFFVTFFPASMLAGLAAPAVWAVRREAAARFLLAWLVPSWIVFEVVITKLPHYVLPLYPAIAILTAAAVESKVLSQRRWLERGVMWWFLAPVIVSIIAVVTAVIIERDLALLAWPFFAAAVVRGLFAWQLYDPEGAEARSARRWQAPFSWRSGSMPSSCRRSNSRFPALRLRKFRARHRAPLRSPPAPGMKSRAWCFLPAPRRTLPMRPAPPTSCCQAAAGLPSSKHGNNALSPCAPRRSGCATIADLLLRATTSALASRCRLRCSKR